MSMDGLSLLAVSHELQQLVGGKVDRVQQPERDTLLMIVRAGGSNYRLLLCVHPENGRVQFTERQYVNPPEPPMFCMLLRKRLTGGRIRAITQPNADRLLCIQFEARDELGDLDELQLVVELMGKHSNLCLVGKNDILLDCARHVSPQMSSVRVLMPGVAYEFPPSQNKQNPLTANEADFLCALQGSGKLFKHLTNHFFGISPDCARQLIARWSGDAEIALETLNERELAACARFLSQIYAAFSRGEFEPSVMYNDTKEPVAIYPFAPAVHRDNLRLFVSMSEALDTFYQQRDARERFRRRSASLQRALQNNLERCYKKLQVYEAARTQGEDLEALRLFGELIMAHAHTLSRGMQYARLPNYYTDPPSDISVPLDERLSPQENAQRYFKRYQKGKAAKALAVEQCRVTSEEIAYLEGQLDNLTKCSTDTELQEIRDELVKENYVKPEAGKKQPQKQAPSRPLHYQSSDGADIYVGKNNKQNDSLTLRFARSEDIWLHTKNIPGSHVIIQTEKEPSNTTLMEAAMLAAYYSKARTSASVPVDYCPRKYVKKPAGAKPGMVIYTTNRTIYITPDEAQVKRMKLLDE
ncbi:NFACT family protein [Christensenellaceae bacterium OttesenSCG-928-L17]|nr:NFACT family protein [Christensenellaceae bacterium OttesenSCG-928-L17]